MWAEVIKEGFREEMICELGAEIRNRTRREGFA